jgi:hypothetical protein
MAFRTNYSQQRGDRDRAKRQKQQDKLKKREDDAARRKAARGEGTDTAPTDADTNIAGLGQAPSTAKPEDR